MSLEELVNEGIIERIGQPTRVNAVNVFDCGTVEYRTALKLQQVLREQRKRDKISDTALILEHHHVYTVGRGVKDEKMSGLIVAPLEYELIRVGRGGNITYHGPGQIVTYFICKIPFDDYGEAFKRKAEKIGIDALKEYGINAYSRKLEPGIGSGVWVNVNGIQKKIIALGLEFSRAPKDVEKNQRMATSMHGIALNINTDLRKFKRIHPCGFNYDVMTSMKEILGREINIDEVKKVLAKYLKRELEKNGSD